MLETHKIATQEFITDTFDQRLDIRDLKVHSQNLNSNTSNIDGERSLGTYKKYFKKTPGVGMHEIGIFRISITLPLRWQSFFIRKLGYSLTKVIAILQQKWYSILQALGLTGCNQGGSEW